MCCFSTSTTTSLVSTIILCFGLLNISRGQNDMMRVEKRILINLFEKERERERETRNRSYLKDVQNKKSTLHSLQ